MLCFDLECKGAGSGAGASVFDRFEPRVNWKSPSSSSNATAKSALESTHVIIVDIGADGHRDEFLPASRLLLRRLGCVFMLSVSKGFRVLITVVIDNRAGCAEGSWSTLLRIRQSRC